MTSQCPSCRKEIEHEDYLFEVICDCGVRFNPFMPAVPTDSEPSASPPQSGLGALGNFSESEAVFDELRSFGENLLPGQPEHQVPPAIEQVEEPGAYVTNTTGSSSSGAHIFVTSADSLNGLLIASIHGAVSAIAPLDAGAPSPLGPVFEQLADRASMLGATAVVACRWNILSDGQVLASGTAVRAALAKHNGSEAL